MLVSNPPPEIRAGDETMSLIHKELYDALIEAGASEQRARAAAAAMPDIERLATKDDIAQLRAEIAATRAESKQDNAELRAELKQDKAELKQDIADLKREVAVTKFGTFTMGPAILALLIKLTFFP